MISLPISLADVRNWLKGFDVADNYYIGKLDSKKDKSLGVYSLKTSGAPITAVGNESTYSIKGISLLLHWNNNAAQTEEAANALYDKLRTIKNVRINDTQIYMIQLLVPEPVSVGTDDKGIYEYVIEMNLFYERRFD